jgi:serine phosphatase RsbU (regulator of sigma subunit)/streptogramin lyase
LTGLHQFDRRKETFFRYRHHANNPYSLSQNRVSSIVESQSGTLWVGTLGGGINKFDREGPRFRTYKSESNQEGSLSSNAVFSVCLGRNGVLWLGTDRSGLDRVTRHNTGITVKNFRNVPGDPASLSHNFVYAIHEDRKGNLWVGTGFGLDLLEPETGAFRHYRSIPGDPASIGGNPIQTILESRSGVLWFGAIGGGLNRFHPETGSFTRYLSEPGNPRTLTGNALLSMTEGRSGTIWIGTYGYGLNAFDPQTGRVTRYLNEPGTSGTPLLYRVQCIHEDKNGFLWLGTFGGGLKRFQPKTGDIRHFREKHGLPNDVVYGILEDGKGFLWLSTNKGLSRFDPRTYTFNNYNARDGLQSNEFNSHAFFKAGSGEMFFGGINGLNSFFPAQVRDNPFVPPIVITDFRISNQPVTPGPGSVLNKHISETGSIALSHTHNVFSFEFVALDYTIPEKNRYAYMMVGFDKDWNYTSYKKRFATYTNLDAGDYEFRVKGSNNDGVWNSAGASIKITIKPPLTKTWWFRILAALLAIGLSVYVYKNRMRELSQQTRLKTELQTARDAQMSIMPQSDPEVPGFDISGVCVPASEVGGDFFDYLWLDEKKTRFGIAIGDVSGKSMKAAMTAVMSDGILFSKASETDSIKEIMTRVNRPLYFKTDKRMFTALCLASLHVHTRELIFTNAGLNHPILKTGGTASLIKGEGPQFPLGIRKDSVYREKTTLLEPGDVLLLFTDGIPEAQNPECQFYEHQRLMRFLEQLDTASLTALEIRRRIIDDALAFCGSAPQNDDMTVVVVKVNMHS